MKFDGVYAGVFTISPIFGASAKEETHVHGVDDYGRQSVGVA